MRPDSRPTQAGPSTEARQPVLATGDRELADQVQRLAAATGVVVEIRDDPAAAMARGWTAAPLILIGADLAAAIAVEQPPRRGDVIVVGRSAREDDYRAAVAVGASAVLVLPSEEAALTAVLADVRDGGTRSAVTIGFLGASGGVGATTLACAVGAAGAQRLTCVLVDLDPLGPGVERVLGSEDADGVRWDDLAGSAGRLGSHALRESLPRCDGLAVLGWGASAGRVPEADALREVLSAARRGHDLVVLDLPRHLDDVTSAVAARCDHLVLVGGCTWPAAASAARAAARATAVCGSVHLVARSRPGAVQPEQFARTVGLPLLATMGEQRRLAEHLDLGLGPLHSRRGPVARAAGKILDRLGPGPTA